MRSPLEFPAVYQQHGAVRAPDHGALDLGFQLWLGSVSSPPTVIPLTLKKVLSARYESTIRTAQGPTNEKLSGLKIPPNPTMLPLDIPAVDKGS